MESKSKKLKTIIMDAIFVTLLVVSIGIVSGILEDKSSIKKNNDFFQQKEDFDVLFFGSSHSEIFVNPMILWNKYGIVSYNFGNPEEGIPVSYWEMKSAIEIHKPKVIVFDVSMINRGEVYSNEEHLHYALDSFPPSVTKLAAANDLLTDTNEKIELFFKLGNYHSRWKEITIVDDPFVKGSLSYGEYHTMRVQSFEQFPITNKIADIDENNRDLVYITKIIDLCRENDIDLVLAVNPFQCTEGRQADLNRVEQLAKQNGVPFINFIKMGTVIDYDVDLYDCEHVNQSGLNKMCDYWGTYLTDNYQLNDYRDDKTYSSWNSDYEDFKQLKYESLWWIVDNIEVIIQGLHDKDIKSYVFIGKDSNVPIEEEHFKRLIQNIGRENVVVDSEQTMRSEDLFPLKILDEAYKVEDYGVLISDGYGIEERTDIGARELLLSLYNDVDLSSNDVVVVIADNETNEVKMVRKYNNSTDDYEIIYLDIPKVYFN